MRTERATSEPRPGAMSRGAGAPLRSRGPYTAHLQVVAIDQPPDQPPDDLPDHEPTDEELWLEDVARQVEADARPLFAALWLELLRRALEADDDEPGDAA